MEIYNLSSNEVNRLIKSLKTFKESATFKKPILGKIKDDTPLIDYENQIEYKFHRYRHPLDSTRFSLHMRFTENNDHLIRLDVNNGTHRNPDGRKIEQNHLHIYNRKLERKDAFAISLPK